MILQYFLAGWFVLGMIVTIGAVGKRPTPTTPGGAVFTCVINLAIIAAIFAWWPQ